MIREEEAKIDYLSSILLDLKLAPSVANFLL